MLRNKNLNIRNKLSLFLGDIKLTNQNIRDNILVIDRLNNNQLSKNELTELINNNLNKFIYKATKQKIKLHKLVNNTRWKTRRHYSYFNDKNLFNVLIDTKLKKTKRIDKNEYLLLFVYYLLFKYGKYAGDNRIVTFKDINITDLYKIHTSNYFNIDIQDVEKIFQTKYLKRNLKKLSKLTNLFTIEEKNIKTRTKYIKEFSIVMPKNVYNNLYLTLGWNIHTKSVLFIRFISLVKNKLSFDEWISELDLIDNKFVRDFSRFLQLYSFIRFEDDNLKLLDSIKKFVLNLNYNLEKYADNIDKLERTIYNQFKKVLYKKFKKSVITTRILVDVVRNKNGEYEKRYHKLSELEVLMNIFGCYLEAEDIIKIYETKITNEILLKVKQRLLFDQFYAAYDIIKKYWFDKEEFMESLLDLDQNQKPNLNTDSDDYQYDFFDDLDWNNIL